MNQKQVVWDLPVRIFHWTLAASFAAAYAISDSERWRNLHVAFGYTVLGLVAFRLLWGFVGTHHARFASFRYRPAEAIAYLKEIATGRARHYTGHNPAGSWAVYAILALGAGTAVSGYLTLNEIGGDAFEEVHEFLANTWLVVVSLHVAGVIASSLAHRENLVRAMVTGYKRGAGERPATGLGVSAVGLAVAAAVLGFWGWTMLAGGGAISSAEATEDGHDGEHLLVDAHGKDDD
ncbi:MAG: cytochrome b/b6 domain-containing protein [Steroidobacteraceae bacterium]